MDNEALRIPKKLHHVELWTHPEGRVAGSIYLHLQSNQHAGEERPEEVLNQPEPFLVLRCYAPEELRFYNKKSIIRVQYRGTPSAASPDLVTLGCRLHMMDGCILSGVIKEFLLPAHRRLFDYINHSGEAFIKLHLASGEVCLINKAYIVRVSADPDAGGQD